MIKLSAAGGATLATISDMSAFMRTVNDDTTGDAVLTTLGVTAAVAELNYVDGVTSAIQTQIDGKSAAGHAHAAADITSGTIATARLGSGTANNTTFLRGDQTYAAISGLPTTVAQTSQISVTSDATLSSPDNDTLMTATLGVGTWKVDIHGRFTAGSSGGAKCDFTFSGTAAGSRQGMCHGVAIAGLANLTSAMTIATTAVNGSAFWISALVTVTVQGTILFRFCQDTTNATATVIAANNAWMDYRQIA